MSANHDKFLANLKKSHDSSWRFVQWFARKGYGVVTPRIRLAKSHADWRMGADSGDMFVQVPVEHKHTTKHFTCREDWPFKTFIVCAKHSYDRADPKPWCYLYLNAKSTHMAMVKQSTRRHWTVETIRDNRYDNYEQKVYMCPLEHVQFMKFDL